MAVLKIRFVSTMPKGRQLLCIESALLSLSDIWPLERSEWKLIIASVVGERNCDLPCLRKSKRSEVVQLQLGMTPGFYKALSHILA